MTSKKRIAVFLNIYCYQRNGRYYSEESSYQFWFELADKFEHLTLCLPTTDDPERGNFELQYDPEKVTILPMPYYKSSKELYLRFPFHFAPALKKATKELWPNIDFFVSVAPNIMGLYLTWLSERNKTPVGFFVRGDLVLNVKLEYRFSRFKIFPIAMVYIVDFISLFRMRNRMTMVVGHELERKYRERGVHAVGIIENPIGDKDVVRGRKLQAKERYQCLLVSRMSPEKGVDALLESLAILRDKHGLEVDMKIVGDGADMPRMEQMKKDLKLDGVDFLGYMSHGPELTKLWRESDLFIVPSYSEGFPKTVTESMSHACPIVTTRVGGIPFLMKDGHDCLIVEPHDPPALADAVAKVLKDNNLRQELLDNATATVSQYTMDQMGALFLQNMNKALAR